MSPERVGTIKKISINESKGLAEIHFEDESSALIESNFGLRQLIDAFDGDPIGDSILYYTNEYGLMIGFDSPSRKFTL